MDGKYSVVRERYRDLVQEILSLESGDPREKALYSAIYRQKNVRKSIDTTLRQYSDAKATEGLPMRLTDEYWREYQFSRAVTEAAFDKQLADFEAACKSYFGLAPRVDGKHSDKDTASAENFKEFDPASFIQSYLNNETITKMFNDMSQFTEEKKTEKSETDEVVGGPAIEFPEEIVKLAQELSNEIQIPDFLTVDGDPTDTGAPKRLFDKLTTAEGQEMFRNLIEKTSDKIKRKIDSGEIDEEKIKNSAQGCLKSFMEKNSELQDIFNKNFSGQAFDLFNQTVAGKAPDRDPSDVRMRLQKKLKKRHTKSKYNNNNNNIS